MMRKIPAKLLLCPPEIPFGKFWEWKTVVVESEPNHGRMIRKLV